MHDRNGFDSSTVEQFQSTFQRQELARRFIEHIELEEVVRQFLVVNAVLRIRPLAVDDKLLAQHLLKHIPFDGSPLLEEVVLRMHSSRDLVTTTLQNKFTVGEVQTDIRAVKFLFDDQRRVRQDRGRRIATESFVV